MEIGFELENMKTFHFTPEHCFKMYLALDDEAYPDTVGQDSFGYNGSLLPVTTVAATGRNYVHEFKPGLDAYKGKPSIPVNIGADTFDGMTLWLENNAILSQGELQTYYMLRAIINGHSYPVSLLTTKVRVHWHGLGTYRISLDSLNSILSNQISAKNCGDKASSEHAENDSDNSRL